jgi:hypothetical protein
MVTWRSTEPIVRWEANRTRAEGKPCMSAMVLVDTVPSMSLVKPR